MTEPTTPTTPTQVAHPWRATLRTAVAIALAIILVLPFIITADDLAAMPWLGGVLAVAGLATRILANPTVAALVAKYLPWLAPTPKS